jgi:peptide/nickel transport system permease protein
MKASVATPIGRTSFSPKAVILGIARSRGVKRFFRNPLSVTGLFLIVVFCFVALFANWLAPTRCELEGIPAYDCTWDANQIPQDGISQLPKPPRAEAWATFPPDWRLHPFGLTQNGYDLYYGIIWGTRNAFFVGTVVVFSSLFFGLIFGSLAGFFGGWIDMLLMRTVDILFVFPSFILAIVLVVIIGSNPILPIVGKVEELHAAMFAIGIVNWLIYARLIRGDILSAKEKEYVQAARAVGSGNTHIIWKHILPNTIYPVIVFASLDIGSIVLSIAGLSFLGLGPEPGYADWGQLISFARQFVVQPQYWYVTVIPSLAITLFVLGWNLLGDAFRDILDPKMRGRGS